MAASFVTALLARPMPLFAAAAALRAVMLIYGLWQDANSPVKYTDIDYLVFTDAARFTFAPQGDGPAGSLASPAASPYTRETYRYTPLLAWMLYPTVLPGVFWFSFGKVLFAAADLAAGWLLVLVLRRHMAMPMDRALKYASIWLLNPMVATISTRGSSEGLLGVMVMALLYAVLERRVVLAGLLLGFSVHFKIYPFIYAPAIVWWMDASRMRPVAGKTAASKPSAAAAQKAEAKSRSALQIVHDFLTPERIQLTIVSLGTFTLLNVAMYAMYGMPFLEHTFLHHVTRIDHRHNFSPYNILLYLSSAAAASAESAPDITGVIQPPVPASSAVGVESVAFLPQLLLSTVLIPLVGAKKNLPATMLAQTFAFVTFNKVCTSQYFLWYLIFLPLYLPSSSLLRKPTSLGLPALLLWIATQGAWLSQGYNLEFLGLSTFLPGLWLSSLAFFLVNCWILGIIVGDFDSADAVDSEDDVAVSTKSAS
ncbi:PIG-M-domain-containing protein [Microdochium trichocladiopsis]|uniref:GPI mannosyltransferase 1 n=1 Tax=Microdochium trichocladiopsis TaxID=1682393 RepID=A0A9P9BRZ4_9PEZI|nr:PIG-M-domain-containing protein [Microdochium trichocladiopsis]KAH7027790.1 PIG-M-domain-containing protein [Microdochium trichocladiopsis]